MFGLPEALMSFIRRQVGLRTDAASSTGSLHAKVKDIVDNQLPMLQKPRGIQGVPGSYVFSTTATWFTALNLTSTSGKLLALKIKGNVSRMHGLFIKLTIDGNVVMHGTGRSGGIDGRQVPSQDFLFITDGVSAAFVDCDDTKAFIPLGLAFKESLRIEVYNNQGDTFYIYWQYEKE